MKCLLCGRLECFRQFAIDSTEFHIQMIGVYINILKSEEILELPKNRYLGRNFVPTKIF